MTGKSLIFAWLGIDRILHFVFFMIKYFKFTDNIGSGDLLTHFVKIPTNLKEVGAGGCYTLPPSPTDTHPAWHALANKWLKKKKENHV